MSTRSSDHKPDMKAETRGFRPASECYALVEEANNVNK